MLKIFFVGSGPSGIIFASQPGCLGSWSVEKCMEITMLNRDSYLRQCQNRISLKKGSFKKVSAKTFFLQKSIFLSAAFPPLQIMEMFFLR